MTAWLPWDEISSSLRKLDAAIPVLTTDIDTTTATLDADLEAIENVAGKPPSFASVVEAMRRAAGILRERRHQVHRQRLSVIAKSTLASIQLKFSRLRRFRWR